MSPREGITEVIVVPRNGYANRLQAWASASILAAQFDAPVKVLWESESIASTPADRMFHTHGVGSSFIRGSDLTRILGVPHQELPRYLHADATRGFVSIAGHEQGEQVFVDRLPELLSTISEPITLVLIAGGKFHLPFEKDFSSQRRIFYNHLSWSDELNLAYSHQLDGRGNFVALHVRETDRSLEAPTPRQLRDALYELSRDTSTRSLLIAADTSSAREHWATEARTFGFEPWSVADVEFDRSSPANGLSAMLDWRLLARASAVIHPRASTFSAEAVVAGGTRARARALHAPTSVRVGRGVMTRLRSLATYPSRLQSNRRE